MSEKIEKICGWCDAFDCPADEDEGICLETDEKKSKNGTCEQWENDDVGHCDICKELADNPDKCGRCGKMFCDDCSGDDNIPYRCAEDYCSECGDEFQNIWTAFTCGQEIHVDKVEAK